MSNLVTAESNELTTTDEQQLVTMIVDRQLFGIPILMVQDIVEPSQITPVPLSPSAIAGVLNLRGRIVTVIDLRELLGAPEQESNKQMSVTVEHKGDLYTLLVDSIGDVRSLPRKDFDKPPTTLDENMRRLCSGIFRLEDNLLVVLDVDRILDEETLMKTPRRTRRRRNPSRTPARKAEKAANDSDDGHGDAEAKTGGASAGKTEKVDRAATTGSAKPAEKSKAPAEKADDKVVELKPARDSKPATPAAPAPSRASTSASKYNLAGDNAEILEALGGQDGAERFADQIFDLVMGDPTVNHFAEEGDLGDVRVGFREFATSLAGGAGRDLDDLVVILELLVRELGLDDDHFISIAKHTNEVLSKARVNATAVHSMLERIDFMRNKVVKH